MKKISKKAELSRRITQLIGGLPLFPRDIDRLLATAIKPSQDNVQILRLIKSDAKLGSELLQLARSYYGKSEKFETIEDAVHSIGVQPLVQLIGVSYARKAIQEEFAALKYLNQYVDHCEEVSICCRILTKIRDMPTHEREIYVLAGLVHDVGRLAIMVAGNKTDAHVLGTLWDKMASVIYDEKTAMGTNHCEVGMQICRRWNLSPVIQEGVLRHHTPLVDGDFSFCGALIFVSHFLSASDPSREIVSTLLPAELLSKLNLTADDFDKAKNIYNSRSQDNLG